MTGALLWRSPEPHEILSGVTVSANGVVYFGSNTYFDSYVGAVLLTHAHVVVRIPIVGYIPHIHE